MLKNIAILEMEKNGRIYQLHLPNDSPLGEAHDVLFTMKAYVLDRLKQIEESEKNASQPPENVETPKG